ncbi:MAG: ABC transporter ATP-binding protein [Rubrimonas sp.]|uniref:ABC transporter ATP-binding protein n=1 Tax=Rubrimonas sp. TaxID=2036015 RepID=UPI002FDCFB28
MLEVRGIDSFYGAAKILRGVSLSARAGEVVALLGRNGAGKTTTMKSIMGLVRPRAGTVRYDGRDITGQPPHLVCRAGLGYVPEERRIFKTLTVQENLTVGERPARDGAPFWTVERLFALFPNLAERRRNPGGALSGGEQQMLTIARTLMGNPSLVLLDEPSEGIAPVIVEQMARVILQLKGEGLTVLLSEQNLHFARLVADRACVLEKGEVKFEGAFADLEADPEIGARYLAV